jgi:hypothetical protein
MTMLTEVVDAVIGTGTHRDTREVEIAEVTGRVRPGCCSMLHTVIRSWPHPLHRQLTRQRRVRRAQDCGVGCSRRLGPSISGTYDTPGPTYRTQVHAT